MKLTKEQLDAINHVEGPCLVLAVPGSGKTTVLINRAFNLINQHNINPKNILSITFSKSSTVDMQKRFINTFNVPSPFFATIHSFAYSIVRRYSSKTNIRYTLIEDRNEKYNKYNIIEDIYFKYNNKRISEDNMDTLLNDIGYIKNMMMLVDDFLKYNTSTIPFFKKIYLDYEKFKRENNLIDFDDMLTHALNILNKDEELLKLYRNQFKYIQVDEGQDTCKLQFEIIKKVAYPNNNLFVVADDDQCIYGFRGANPEELLKLEKEYPSLKKFYMDKNFRSTQNIVTFSNEFIKSNKERFEKNINTDNDSFKAPIIAKLENNFDQYSYILNDIKKNNLDINSTAILYRNNISSIGMINELKNNNIPFIIKDINFKFFNHWILTDLYKFINFSKDQSNLMLFYDIYYKTNAFISKKQMNFINKLNPNQNVFDRLLEHPDIREIDKRRIRVLKMDFNKLKKLNPYSAIDLIEHELGYKDFLKENANFTGANYSSLITILNNIKLISKDIKNFDELEEKINDLKNYSVKSSKNNEGITLTTVHSSKGLEFENVYIIDLINSEFPNESYIDESDTLSLEEERRLFYVAMTRAKKYLNLVTYRYSSYESVDESLFLKELRDIVKK